MTMLSSTLCTFSFCCSFACCSLPSCHKNRATFFHYLAFFCVFSLFVAVQAMCAAVIIFSNTFCARFVAFSQGDMVMLWNVVTGVACLWKKFCLMGVLHFPMTLVSIEMLFKLISWSTFYVRLFSSFHLSIVFMFTSNTLGFLFTSSYFIWNTSQVHILIGR